MNLQKLFEMQAKLDVDITAHHPVQEGENRLEKKVLALLVELGECTNEWRGFKFWSNDQEPRVTETCGACDGKGYKRRFNLSDGERRKVKCSKCGGSGATGNPLLEEFIDVLHFVLSIGNELSGGETKKITASEIKGINVRINFLKHTYADVLKTFNKLFLSVATLGDLDDKREYTLNVFPLTLLLGEQLGFTWEQIEQAYYDKNKVNFERQEQGY